MAGNVSASCLCGGVTVQVSEMADTTEVCHCGTCRKWGGGPLFAVSCGTEVSFAGEANIVRYDSSDWGQRGFCGKCGTHLFFLYKPQALYLIPAGFFTERNDLSFDKQIFIDEKPPYYSFANDTQALTGEETVAAFSTSQQS